MQLFSLFHLLHLNRNQMLYEPNYVLTKQIFLDKDSTYEDVEKEMKKNLVAY